MAKRATKVKVETVARDLSAIRDLSISYGFPLEWKDFPQIKQLKKGLFNVYGKSEPDKRKPVTFEILKQFYSKLNIKLYFDDLMFFTWMVIMVVNLLRTTEGAAAHKFVTPNGIDRGSQAALWCKNLNIIKDNTKVNSVKYMILTLKATKNSVHNQSVETVIGHGIDPINPVKLMITYLTKRKLLSRYNKKLLISPNAPLFLFEDGSILTRNDASLLLNDLAFSCKLTGKYSGQSFRMGGGTSLAQRNYSNHVIQRAGRWKSDAFKTYIRLDNEFLANLPLNAMLAPIVNQYAQFGYQKSKNRRVGGR